MRKKTIVMISVGHRRKKIQVKPVKIGPFIDNIIIIIIITAFAERHPKLVARKNRHFSRWTSK